MQGIRQLLEKARAATGSLEFLRCQISDIRTMNDQLHVAAQDGRTFSTRRVVLALGNLARGR
jgi:predicted flavoprotein YhiN